MKTDMAIKVVYRGKELEFDDKELKVKDLLQRMGLSPLSTIVIRGEEILSEEDSLREGDTVRVVNAISGGSL